MLGFLSGVQLSVEFVQQCLARQAAGNSLSLFLSYIIPEQQIDTPPCPDSQEQEWPKKSDKIQGWVVIGHNMGRDDILSNTIQHNPNSWEGPAPDHLPDPSPDSLNGQSLHSVVSRCPQPFMIQWNSWSSRPVKVTVSLYPRSQTATISLRLFSPPAAWALASQFSDSHGVSRTQKSGSERAGPCSRR